MGWNPFNRGNMRGNRNASMGKKSVGVISQDSVDKYDQPIRTHVLPRRRTSAHPKGDGFDDLRISMAEDKRERRRLRNLKNQREELFGQHYSLMKIHPSTQRDIAYWEGRTLSEQAGLV